MKRVDILRMIDEERQEWIKDAKECEYDATYAINALTQLEWKIKEAKP